MQVVERWILARMRHRRFFSLVELNRAIAQLLVELNHRPFKRLPGCRAEAFAALDAPALRPLPATPMVLAQFKAACARAQSIRAPHYRSVKSILASGLDRRDSSLLAGDTASMPAHSNVRGPGYYGHH